MTITAEQLGLRNSVNGPADGGTPVSEHGVLQELFELLEDYAPTWYTSEHHDRAVAALLRRGHQGAA